MASNGLHLWIFYIYIYIYICINYIYIYYIIFIYVFNVYIYIYLHRIFLHRECITYVYLSTYACTDVYFNMSLYQNNYIWDNPLRSAISKVTRSSAISKVTRSSASAVRVSSMNWSRLQAASIKQRGAWSKKSRERWPWCLVFVFWFVPQSFERFVFGELDDLEYLFGFWETYLTSVSRLRLNGSKWIML